MKNDLMVCPHCRKDTIVRLSSNIGIYFHLKGDYFLIDVVLLFSETSLFHVLYREVYVVESKKG